MEAFIIEQLLASAQRFLAAEEAAAAPVAAATTVAEAPPPPPPRGLSAAERALLPIQKQAAALGLQLLPLRGPGDIATMLEVELLYPAGTPHRTKLVLGELRSRHLPIKDPFELEMLLRNLDASESWAQALSRLKLPGETRCTLLPPVSACAVCGSSLRDESNGRPSFPTVYSCRGVLKGSLFSRRCTECNALHNMSYASGGKLLSPGEQLFYDGAAQLEWFQRGAGTVYETQLLLQLNTQMVHSHTGWETFAREYVDIHGGGATLVGALRKVLARDWLAWSLLSWCDEMVAPPGPINVSSDAALDSLLLSYHDKLVALFVFKWGTEHEKVCRTPGSCFAYILDGHMKCKRVVCAWTRARLIRQPELGDLVLGCLRSPLPGSRFCAEHAGRSACRSSTSWEEPELVEAPPPPPAFSGWASPERRVLKRVARPAAKLTTAEPTSSEPAASEPAASQPAASQPTASDPAAKPAAPAVDSTAAAAPLRRSNRVAASIAAAAATAAATAAAAADESVAGLEEEEEEKVMAETWEVRKLVQHRTSAPASFLTACPEHASCAGDGMRYFQVPRHLPAHAIHLYSPQQCLPSR